MSNLYISIIITLSIFAAPALFFMIYGIYSGIKYLIMRFIYKFDLFGAREKWLKEHPNWDKHYTGNSMLAGLIDNFSREERPW